MKKPCTIKELYRRFTEKYTPNQIAENIALQTIYQYLSEQMKRAGGNFIHIPSDYLCQLIKDHLGVSLEDKMYTKGEPGTQDDINEDDQDEKFWMECNAADEAYKRSKGE